MSSKHIFQSSEDLVLKSLRGITALDDCLGLDSRTKVVYVHQTNPDTKVALVAGGGAGHEPAHAGYTGRGMLAASVSGDIFASPGASQILSAIRYAANNGRPSSTHQKDVLVIINNYTGDCLNFGLAIEKAKKEFPGINIGNVVVSDDVALLGTDSAVGPRGLAGNVLVCKILGAFAEGGNDLASVKALGETVIQNLASVGVGLAHCHLPGQKGESLHLMDDECEIGLGLHNEAGVKKAKIIDPTSLVKEMIQLLNRGGKENAQRGRFVTAEDEYVLFVNNLGGISQLEMGAVLDETLVQLGAEGLKPIRTYLSSFMTSLNAPGFSISMLNASKIEREMIDKNIQVKVLDLCDWPTEALAWPRTHQCGHTNVQRHVDTGPDDVPPTQRVMGNETRIHWETIDVSPYAVLNGLRGACRAVLDSADDMTEFDTILGDGDCGDTFAKGAKAVLRICHEMEPTIKSVCPGDLVGQLGVAVESSMGGTIGALFAIFITAWSEGLSSPSLPPSNWLSTSMDGALNTLSTYTPARRGDRTLIDALGPLIEALGEKRSLKEAVGAARSGAESTRSMEPKLGRVVYVASGKHDRTNMPPDPGAWGIAAIAEGFLNGYTGLNRDQA